MKAKVMIVDDDIVLQTLLQGILEDDYELVVCETGEECLEHVIVECPDIILLDVQMPGIDGFTVCEQLKDDSSTSMIPVIFISSVDSEYEKEEAFRVGGDDLLFKPVDEADLKSVLEVAVSMLDRSD